MSHEIHQILFTIDQTAHELCLMADENVANKLKLARLLSRPLQQNELEAAEQFQNLFIRNDHILYLLKNDIDELKRFALKATDNCEELERLLEDLRKMLRQFQSEFWKVKEKFNRYLSVNDESC